MKKIYIYGLGKGKKYVDRCLIKNNVQILGYVDNYKAGNVAEIDNVQVIKSDEIREEFDYLVVTLMQFEDVKENLIELGIPSKKIICFFSFQDIDNEGVWDVLDVYKWRTELMWRHYVNKMIPIVNNYPYEMYNDSKIVSKDIPNMVSAEDTIEILNEEKKCLARFGDNEFELILGRKRTNYQDISETLGTRLKEVLESKLDNLLIAIADNYGSLEKYTDEAAMAIREYLGDGARIEHMKLLDNSRIYYDAYLSRPYIIYRDKLGAKERFENIRKIWKKQEVLIVEGEHTRFGVGNNLLDNALTVHRVLAPNKNAFSKYDEILQVVRKLGENKLILVILGPTATIMTYDLAKEGFWAIDIGQLDVEYEWYLRGVTQRCDIPYKQVSEVLQYNDILTSEDEYFIQKYKSEIIARILE